MVREPKVLLAEDHPIYAERLAALVGEDDSGPFSPDPPSGRLKWLRSPLVAVEFLREQAAREDGWRPDFVLVDFHFEGYGETGLSVAAAADQYFPDAELVAFSGQAMEHGRWLFHAALYHWFGCRRVLLKTDATSSYAELLRGVDTTPPLDAERLAEHASLVDLFFHTPVNLDIFATWDSTRGERNIVVNLPSIGSRSTADRRLDELAQLGATFVDAFGLTVFRGGLKDGEGVTERLNRFMDANQIFFADPQLAEVVYSVRPWDRVERAEVVVACDLAGHPVSAR